MQDQLTLAASPRPPRRMPTLWAIASYWEARGPFLVVLEHPHCFGCQEVTGLLSGSPSSRWRQAGSMLDKAHLVDRSLAGLDGPQNVVPLCRRCHMAMPRFGSGLDAIHWVLTGGRITRSGLAKPDAELAPCSRNGAHYSVADEPRCREAVETIEAGFWYFPGLLLIDPGYAATEG